MDEITSVFIQECREQLARIFHETAADVETGMRNG